MDEIMTAPPAERMTAAEAANLHFLDPAETKFERHGATLRLSLSDRCYLRVTVVRAFPLSEPHRYLSVRDGEKKEIGILRDAHDLDPAGARLVAEELRGRYMVPSIRRIIRIKERFGTADWEVETDRGRWTFSTRNLRDNVVRPSPDRYILTDVDGNRFDIHDLSELDPASQALVIRQM